MIELTSAQLLQFTLLVESAAMAIITGVFFMVVRATRGARAAQWAWGWGFFAAALLAEGVARMSPSHAWACHYAAAACSVACAYFTSKASFEFRRLGQLPPWVLVALGATAAGAFAVASRGTALDGMFATEIGLLAATTMTAVALWPVARKSSLSGVRTACATATLLTLLIGRTLISGAILRAHGQELNALYWIFEAIGGGILAFVLAMGELVAILEEIRVELEDSNGALSGAMERLEVAAKIDALTGLYNRYAFHAIVADLRRHRTLEGAVAVLDLNGLKRINDTYGHHAGDRALRHVARSLQQMVRTSDYVFRWGGDEFVVLLFDVTPEVARERLAHMPAPEPLQPRGKQPVELSVSWGVAPLAYDVETCLKEADAYLYDQRRLIRSAAEKLGTV